MHTKLVDFIFENESHKDLTDLAKSSKDLNSFLSSIITDYDTRYKNRKFASSFIKDVPISEVLTNKPVQNTHRDVVLLCQIQSKITFIFFIY